MHRVTGFTSISRVASCQLVQVGPCNTLLSVWQVTDKPLFNGSVVASAHRRRRCGGRMSGASLARRRVDEQRRRPHWATRCWARWWRMLAPLAFVASQDRGGSSASRSSTGGLAESVWHVEEGGDCLAIATSRGRGVCGSAPAE